MSQTPPIRRPRARWAARAAVIAAAGLLPALLVAPVAAAHGGGRTVEIEDRCDVADFTAVLGPDICITGDGNVTVAELLDEANVGDGGHGAWRFDREELTIRAGEHVHVHNVGGEGHTFTPVARFGRTGVVPPLDEALPPGDAVPLADPFASFTPPGASFQISGLAPGTYLFECFIHPWMQTTLTVRR